MSQRQTDARKYLDALEWVSEELRVPNIAVRHADERWADTGGEPIAMTDARPDPKDSSADRTVRTDR